MMKRFDIYRLLKLLCMFICMAFMLTACGDDDGGNICGGEHSEDSSEMADEQRTCWQKDFLSLLYKSLGSMSLKVYTDVTAENLLTLMVLAFSIWMAFQVLQHVSATTPESMGEFWTKILRKAALCFACGFLASSTDNILFVINTFIMPIYVTLLEFSAHVLDIFNKTPEAQASCVVLPGNEFQQEVGAAGICEPYDYKMDTAAGCAIPDGKIVISPNHFPDEPLNLMGCMACAVSSRLSVGYSIAIRVLCMDGFIPVLIALFLMAAFTITKFAFALYLIDSIFRLDIMIVIMPFLILFYPFEQTRKWSGIGFKIILNSSALMLCLSVMLGMTVLAMQNILSNPSLGIPFGDEFAYESFGTVPMSMIFLGFVVFKACGLAVSLSDSITGGSGSSSFQKKIAALVGTVGKGLMMIASLGAAKIFTVAADHIQRVRALREKMQKVQQKVSKARHVLRNIAGRNPSNNGGQP